ncbi:hypothetical protein C2845_PM14G01730 [Panicum miliaceum]|uniref:KIB1-4 beta-propeller domain-containing protein n=1 Tax=Panicum miliaceum TaxID=4540 RepID=A0A3L6PRL3_PANMI|nr:hypothetical protein C2845_PM14G01730 [Panicum miliaceum]
MARDTDDPPPSSPWSLSLPPKIAAAVLRRLPAHADRVRFAAVCRPFPGSAALRFPGAAGYHGSSDDWLHFDGGGDGYLLANPFTGGTARLPALSSVRFVVQSDGAALAWRGVTDDWRAPCGLRGDRAQAGRVVAAMVGDRRLGKIAMCRPGAGSWVISAHDAWRGITDIAFYDGKVYAVEDTGDLFAMPTGEDSRTGEPVVAWARCVVKALHAAPPRRRKAPTPPETRYLFVSGGRLLMVHRAVMGDGTTKFAVFRADLVSSRWSEARSVGDDTALFVGRWCTLARRVSQYQLPGNRIHFLDDDAFSRGCADHFGSYDMRDGKTYPFLPPLELRSKACRAAGVISPPTCSASSCAASVPGKTVSVSARSCASTRQHLRRRPGARAPVVSKAIAPAVAATAPPGPAAVYLALPNGRVFSYPELTPSRLLDKEAAGYLGAACDDWLLFHDCGGLFRLTSP